MDPFEYTKLRSLMDISSGSREIVIGIVDGPIDFTHNAFQGSRIRTVRDSQLSACKNATSIACIHGTFVVGILGAKRGVSAPSICPACEIVLRPIFIEESSDNKTNNIMLPQSTPEELSNAIVETIDAGAKIINLSLGLSMSSLVIYDKLQEAYDYALQRGVVIVVAAGNQGNIGSISLLRHAWPIPVAACNENGIFDATSNFGASIGNRGLMAPGINISSTTPGGQYNQMSGTSVSAPFVTGTIALLWSIFPKATAAEIKHSIKAGATYYHHRSIIPPLLNAQQSFKILKRGSRPA